MPQVLHVFRCSEAKSSCICTRRVFVAGSLADVCTLLLRSERGDLAGVLDLDCLLKSAKTGRRFCRARGELGGGGDEGGLDRSGSSEKIAGWSLGLEVRRADESLTFDPDVDASASELSKTRSTRRRLVGGPCS